MSNREDLHRLVDQLPESEARAALRFLEYLRDRTSGDLFLRALQSAPEDDEDETPQEAAAIQEAREAYAKGDTVNDADLPRRLDDDPEKS